MKEIQLTQGYTTQVSDKDYPTLNTFQKDTNRVLRRDNEGV